MPTKVEKDAITGTETTGHEWDGIKELNTPLPKWWLYVLYACIAWSLAYYIFYPMFPGIDGLLGYSQRVELSADLARAKARQAGNLERVASTAMADIPGDPELLNFALTGGRAAFADNCAPCHAPGGAGRPGYPVLADDDWIWGGTLEDIAQTIRYGARNQHEEARLGDMPAFGADELLEPAQLEAVAGHVLSLSEPGAATDGAGAAIYAENCADCHGAAGEGGRDFGAPRLSDPIWLYGGEKADIRAQLTRPRQGVMPSWTGRLDETTIKMLTIYVHALGGGE
jgi:cytochrome c oxidase cbb3-type subunit 3